MNQNMWSLLKIEIINDLNINQIIKSKSKNSKGLRITLVGMVLVGILMIVYNYFMASTLIKINEGSLIPTYVLAVGSVATLFITLFRINGVVFNFNEFQRIVTLPISNRTIICSKMLFMYFLGLAVSMMFWLPGVYVWIINEHPQNLMIIFNVVIVAVNPLIIITVSSIIGLLIFKLTLNFKKSNLASVLASFLIMGIFLYNVLINGNSETNTGSVGVNLYRQINGLYLPTRFLSYKPDEFNILNQFLIILVAILIFIMAIFYMEKNYRKINLYLGNQSNRISKVSMIKRESVWWTLYKKEIDQIFNSYSYFLNATFGVVVLVIFDCIVLLFGVEKIIKAFHILITVSQVREYFPFLIAMMIILSNISSCALSMEGRNVWIIKSLPIRTITIIKVKLVCSVSIHFIAIIMSLWVGIVSLSMNLWEFLSCLMIGGMYSLFASCLGLLCNFYFPDFEWTSDIYVVKQSPAVLISSTIGCFSVMVPIVLGLFTSIALSTIIIWTVIVLLGLVSGLYWKLKRATFYLES